MPKSAVFCKITGANRRLYWSTRFDILFRIFEEPLSRIKILLCYTKNFFFFFGGGVFWNSVIHGEKHSNQDIHTRTVQVHVHSNNLYVFGCQMWQGLIIMPCLSPCWTWRRRSRTTWVSWGGGSPCRPSRARSSRTASSRRDWRSPWLSRASSLVKVAFSVRNTKHFKMFVLLMLC